MSNPTGTEHPEVDPEDLRALAAEDDMYDRFRATLTQYEIDATAAGVLTVALFGGTPRKLHGRRIRGRIHVALVSDATTNTANLLSYLDRITPGSRRANGTGTSYSGLFGDARHSDLNLGLALQDETSVLFLEHASELKSQTLTAFEQVLESGEYTFAKTDVHETVETDATLVFVDEPAYGQWAEYGMVGEQISLPPTILQNVDCLVLDGEPYDAPESVDADPLDPETATAFIEFAREDYLPQLSEDAQEAFHDHYGSLTETFADRDPHHGSVPDPDAEAVARTADALARLRLSETVTAADVRRAVDLHEAALDRLYGSADDEESVDPDTVATGTSKSQRDRIKNLKQLISEIEEEYEKGAPEDVIFERASEIGMEPSKAEHELDKLRQKGEVYEPWTDHLRTT